MRTPPKLKLKAPQMRMTELQRAQHIWPYIASGIPAFRDDAHRREVWLANRENLMVAAAPRKPHGWYLYESDDPAERAKYLASASGGLEND